MVARSESLRSVYLYEMEGEGEKNIEIEMKKRSIQPNAFLPLDTLTLNVNSDAVFAHARSDLIGELAHIRSTIVRRCILHDQIRELGITAFESCVIQINHRVVQEPSNALQRLWIRVVATEQKESVRLVHCRLIRIHCDYRRIWRGEIKR